MFQPLAGMLVVALEQAVAAPYCASRLADAGARVVGTPSTLDEATNAVATLAFDAAILDGNLQGAAVDTSAEALARRGIPFLFLSGYGPEHLPVAFNSRPLLNKSRTAASSATRSGSCQGRITAAVPTSMFGYFVARWVISWRLSGTNE